MTQPIDTAAIRAEMHAARFKDTKVADVARRWILKLCEELEQQRDELRGTILSAAARIAELEAALDAVPPEGEVSIPSAVAITELTDHRSYPAKCPICGDTEESGQVCGDCNLRALR